ncbi:hypothetical protein F5Y17DRAFT_162688 [Xylariaceae sp. FL0594]|nr:hypothetical protein F5Y17DRAFT_162688 [Xylariaceae sp. FL0594]
MRKWIPFFTLWVTSMAREGPQTGQCRGRLVGWQVDLNDKNTIRLDIERVFPKQANRNQCIDQDQACVINSSAPLRTPRIRMLKHHLFLCYSTTAIHCYNTTRHGLPLLFTGLGRA